MELLYGSDVDGSMILFLKDVIWKKSEQVDLCL